MLTMDKTCIKLIQEHLVSALGNNLYEGEEMITLSLNSTWFAQKKAHQEDQRKKRRPKKETQMKNILKY